MDDYDDYDYYLDQRESEKERTFVRRRDYLYKSNALVETKYFELNIHENLAAVFFKTTYGMAFLFGTRRELLVFNECDKRGINDIRSLLDSICFGTSKPIFVYSTHQAQFYGDKPYLNLNIFEGAISVDDSSYTFFTPAVAKPNSYNGNREVYNSLKKLFNDNLEIIRSSNSNVKNGYDFRGKCTVDELIAYNIVNVEATIF